jgi:hypothetical protein
MLNLVVLYMAAMLPYSCQNTSKNCNLDAQNKIETKLEDSVQNDSIEFVEVDFNPEPHIARIEKIKDIQKFKEYIDTTLFTIKLGKKNIGDNEYFSIQYGGEDSYRFYSSYTFLVSSDEQLYYYWPIADSLVLVEHIKNNQLPVKR